MMNVGEKCHEADLILPRSVWFPRYIAATRGEVGTDSRQLWPHPLALVMQCLQYCVVACEPRRAQLLDCCIITTELFFLYRRVRSFWFFPAQICKHKQGRQPDLVLFHKSWLTNSADQILDCGLHTEAQQWS